MLCLTMVNAQEEFVIDFNNYTTGTQCLNGQDSWATHYQTLIALIRHFCI